MKQIDNYFFEDDFEYKEDTFFGVKLFCDGKIKPHFSIHSLKFIRRKITQRRMEPLGIVE